MTGHSIGFCPSVPCLRRGDGLWDAVHFVTRHACHNCHPVALGGEKRMALPSVSAIAPRIEMLSSNQYHEHQNDALPGSRAKIMMTVNRRLGSGMEW